MKVNVIQIPDMVGRYSCDILSTVAIVIDDKNQRKNNIIPFMIDELNVSTIDVQVLAA